MNQLDLTSAIRLVCLLLMCAHLMASHATGKQQQPAYPNLGRATMSVKLDKKMRLEPQSDDSPILLELIPDDRAELVANINKAKNIIANGTKQIQALEQNLQQLKRDKNNAKDAASIQVLDSLINVYKFYVDSSKSATETKIMYMNNLLPEMLAQLNNFNFSNGKTIELEMKSDFQSINKISQNVQRINDHMQKTYSNNVISGSTWQSQLLWGLTDVMLERANEELTVTFVERFQNLIENTPELKPLPQLFPRSYQAIMAIEPVSIQSALPKIQQSARIDFQYLPLQIIDAMPLLEKSWGLKLDREKMLVYQLYISVVREISTGKHPIIALSRFRELEGTGSEPLQLMGIMCWEWYHVQQFRHPNSIANRLHDYNLWLDFTTKLSVKYPHLSPLIKGHSAQLKGFFNELDFLVQESDKLKNPNDTTSQVRADTYSQYARLVSGATLQIIEWHDPERKDSSIAKTSAAIRSANDLIVTIIRKDYPGSVAVLQQAVQSVLVQSNPSNEVHVKLKAMNQVLGFLSGLAMADSSKQVKQVLKQAMLPQGSYRTKRDTDNKSFYFVTVNSYVGVQAGIERAWSTNVQEKTFVGTTGLFAPVGIEIGYPSKGPKKFPASYSLFLQVIDLGALVSYRLGQSNATVSGQDSTATINADPIVGFQQVFSPGISFITGMGRKLPISLGLGYQYLPSLRKVGDGERANAHRFSIWLAVDIPLLRLH